MYSTDNICGSTAADSLVKQKLLNLPTDINQTFYHRAVCYTYTSCALLNRKRSMEINIEFSSIYSKRFSYAGRECLFVFYFLKILFFFFFENTAHIFIARFAFLILKPNRTDHRGTVHFIL